MRQRFVRSSFLVSSGVVVLAMLGAMTVLLAPSTARPAHEVERLLRLTGCALDRTVRAALESDQLLARQQARSRARHRAALVVKDSIRRTAAQPTVGMGIRSFARVIEELQFLEQLIVLNDLLDSLAAVVTRGEVGGLSAADREGMELLRRAGGERLGWLEHGVAGPAMGVGYRQCGEDLFTASQVLSMASTGSGTGPEVRALCSELAGAVLAASRHAARAA